MTVLSKRSAPIKQNHKWIIGIAATAAYSGLSFFGYGDNVITAAYSIGMSYLLLKA